MIDFVITGTGRSGTKWVARALQAGGIPCGHEQACSSWTDDYQDDQIWRESHQVGESSWQAAPFVGEMQAAGVLAVHLVRHPVEVASSMVSNRMLVPGEDGILPWHRFIVEHIGDWIFRLHPHDRALQFWTDWNKQIKHPDLRWLVPVDSVDVVTLAERLRRPVDIRKAFQVPPTVNHWRDVSRLEARQFTTNIYDDAMDLWKSYF